MLAILDFFKNYQTTDIVHLTYHAFGAFAKWTLSRWPPSKARVALVLKSFHDGYIIRLNIEHLL